MVELASTSRIGVSPSLKKWLALQGWSGGCEE